MRSRLATAAAATLIVALLVPVAAVSAASAINVGPGQSIQAAIDSAPAGGVIHVARGTYKGDLEIVRSLHLVGDHAVIVPAAVPTDNLCQTPGFFDGVVGVCIHGAIDFSTGEITPVADVSMEGFTVRDFGGPGIVALAVAGFRAENLVTAHNGEMGMFINMVSRLALRDSRSYGNHGDGIFLENLPEGSPSTNAVITGNRSYDNLGSGIMFINSLGGRITNNDMHGDCGGIVVVAFAGDYGSASGDVSIRHNRVVANNRWCPADGHGSPAYGGVGIGLFGAQNTTVTRNDVRANRARVGSAFPGGGIVIATLGATSDSPGSPSPTGDSVRLNRLSGNAPYDIYGDGTGSANAVSGNKCHSTNLAGAC